MCGHIGLRRERPFDIETETLPVFMIARQFGDDTGDFDVAPLPFIRQFDSEALFGLPCGMQETQSASESAVIVTPAS